MLDFKQYYNELFENPNNIDWTVKTNSLWRGEFLIGDKEYVIKAMKSPGIPWEVKFQLMLGGKPTEKITEQVICLPLFPDLDKTTIEKLVNLIL